MENLVAILSAISSSKDTLDQVNEDIESTIQRTREIEYEIVKCLEIEKSLLLREADLTKMASVTEFEIHSLTQVIVVASSSLELLKKEVDCLRTNRGDIVKRMSENRENFIVQCETFQSEISKEQNGAQMLLLRDSLQKEISELNTKISSLKSSTSLYLEEVLEGLRKSNTNFVKKIAPVIASAVLQVDIQRGTKENDRLLRDIEHLKGSILALSTCDISGLTVSRPKRLKYSYME